MSVRMTQYLVVVVVGMGAVMGAVWLALMPPRLGVPLELPLILESVHGSLPLDSIDLVLEPGEFSRFEEYERFYERQEVLFKIISAPEVKVRSGSADTVVKTRPLSVMDLHFLFWMQVAVGLGSFLISGWVYLVRSRTTASLFFFIAGMCVLLASGSAAVYTTRELALPASLFRNLGFLNALGGGVFGIAIIGLFLVFPLRFAYGRFLFWSQALFFGAWIALFLSRWTWVNLNLGLVVQMVCLVGLLGTQFWRAQNNPRARAAVTWLGLSIIFGGGAFVVFNTIPIILEITPLDQSYAFGFILILFLGVAAGLTEFKLYQSRRWMFRFWVISTVGVAFFLVDLGFLYVLKMGRWPSLGLSFILSLALYLPMREALARYLYWQGPTSSE